MLHPLFVYIELFYRIVFNAITSGVTEKLRVIHYFFMGKVMYNTCPQSSINDSHTVFVDNYIVIVKSGYCLELNLIKFTQS